MVGNLRSPDLPLMVGTGHPLRRYQIDPTHYWIQPGQVSRTPLDSPPLDDTGIALRGRPQSFKASDGRFHLAVERDIIHLFLQRKLGVTLGVDGRTRETLALQLERPPCHRRSAIRQTTWARARGTIQLLQSIFQVGSIGWDKCPPEDCQCRPSNDHDSDTRRNEAGDADTVESGPALSISTTCPHEWNMSLPLPTTGSSMVSTHSGMTSLSPVSVLPLGR
jgi:hypothetical protein